MIRQLRNKILLPFLLLAPLSSAAWAQTAQQKTVMQKVAGVYESGFEYMDAGDFIKSAAAFRQCGEAVEANTGLQQFKVGTSGMTFGRLGEVCYDLLRMGNLDLLAQNAAGTQKVRDYMAQLKTLKGEECYQIANYLIAQYPALQHAMIGGKTVGKLEKECQGQVLAGQPITDGEKARAQEFVPLIQELSKLRSELKAALTKAEKSDPEILAKYKLIQGLKNRAEGMVARVAVADGDASLRRVSVGGMTLGALIDDLKKAQQETARAFVPLKTKADAAFDRQDKVVMAQLPKVLKGDKLTIYKRQGIPSDFSGGPVFSKNGVYSGDGVAVAKDIGSATLWYYNDNGNGCTYKYWFNGNTVSKVEKPYGC